MNNKRITRAGFFALGLLAFAGMARADTKILWGWWPWQYPADFSRPYAEDAKIPLPSQAGFDDWKPADWTAAKGSAQNVMEGLYAGHVLKKQYFDRGWIPFFHSPGGAPVLRVGDDFMKLSDNDKRRVAAYVDSIWQARKAGGGMRLESAQGDPIGIYTDRGLSLQ